MPTASFLDEIMIRKTSALARQYLLLKVLAISAPLAAMAEPAFSQDDQSATVPVQVPGSSGPSTDAISAAEEAEAAAEEAEAAAEPEQAQPAAPDTSAPKAAKAARPFLVRRVVFGPSVYLSAEELAAAGARIEGRRILASRAAAILSEINSLYQSKGIALAEALVTGIDPATGTVWIELFEARIGQVVYRSKLASDAYLDYRLGLKTGDPADNRVIEERLRRLTLTDGSTVNADFQPGAERGFTDLTLVFQDANPYGAFASVDNFGKRSTGEERLNLGVVARSLTGWNDPLNLSATFTERSASGTISYSRPILPAGTRATFSFTGSTSRSFPPVVVDTVSFSGEAGLVHPILLENQRRMQMSALLLGFEEKGDIGGTPVVDQSGWGGQLGLSTYLAGAGWFFGTDHAIRVLDWDDRVAGEAGLTHVGLNGGVNAAARLSDHYAVTLQLGWQVAVNERAPSRYSFGVTGPFAVRGYDPDVSNSDSGVFVRAQVERATPLPLPIGSLELRPFIFADAGRSWDFVGGGHVALDAVASAGAGLTISMGSTIAGSIFVARPLLDANGYVVGDDIDVRASLTATF
mgnify:CR=1 FL=1